MKKKIMRLIGHFSQIADPPTHTHTIPTQLFVVVGNIIEILGCFRKTKVLGLRRRPPPPMLGKIPEYSCNVVTSILDVLIDNFVIGILKYKRAGFQVSFKNSLVRTKDAFATQTWLPV